MLINLVHDLDLMRHLCGEIVAVQAATSNAVRGHAVEDTASVVLTFTDGALGSFLVSDAAVAPWGWDQATEDDPTCPYRPDTSCYSIAGTTGSLSFPQLAHYFHDGGASGDWMRSAVAALQNRRGPATAHTNQLRHFVRVRARRVRAARLGRRRRPHARRGRGGRPRARPPATPNPYP
ncbi:Gfo/Idh/MocA family oxidoreductase [Streptomyces sp. KL116D]|uniref:Gfo/Idh/MocA family protein n=1 Tax=Streptomyces sp. KL116D TaxID=3045152 RepID=UPI0035591F54